MYGRKYMGTARVTFIINESGIIEEIIGKVDTQNHTDQILKGNAPKGIVRKKVTKKTAAKKASKKPLKKVAKSAVKKAVKKKK